MKWKKNRKIVEENDTDDEPSTSSGRAGKGRGERRRKRKNSDDETGFVCLSFCTNMKIMFWYKLSSLVVGLTNDHLIVCQSVFGHSNWAMTGHRI